MSSRNYVAAATNKKPKSQPQSRVLREFVRETPKDSYGQTITPEQHQALCNWLPQSESNDALSDF